VVTRLYRQEWIGALVLLAAGCGDPKSEVTGTVTYEDCPLSSGTVLAVSSDGTTHYGRISPGGHYSLTALPTGTIIWAVTSPDPDAPIVERQRGTEVELPRTTSPPSPGKWFPIPDRYESTSTSKLKSELKPGPNKFDIRLTK
jgi:hypothetical protein